jgi:recombination associated protein RdgC
MFRNVRFYRFDSGWPKTEDESSQLLTTCAFRPCGPLTIRSSGWVPPCPEAGDSLSRRVNGADLLRLRSQSRVLPPSAIAEELEHRIEDYRERMQELPSPREKRRMKSEARDELMPKALLKSDRIFGFVDLKDKLIAIDAAQTSVAERFLRRLGAAVTLANVRPLQFQKPLSDFLSSIFLGNSPRNFAAGRECRMQDAADYGAKVRWNNFDLSDPSIRTHVADGMRLTHLAIDYDNILSCVIDEDGVISKLRFVGMEEDNSDELEPIARQDAEFVLLSGTLRKMIADLENLLGGMN